MIIANGFDEIYQTLDFTDSIIEGIRWENNLLDLVLIVDYYIHHDQGEHVAIRFTDCLKADFSLTPNLLNVSAEEKSAYSISWYTIQDYRLLEGSELLKQFTSKDLIHFQIFTVDPVLPWLSVVSRGIQVEQID